MPPRWPYLPHLLDLAGGFTPQLCISSRIMERVFSSSLFNASSAAESTPALLPLNAAPRLTPRLQASRAASAVRALIAVSKSRRRPFVSCCAVLQPI
jgi:hypothetical protein